jgi:hypothetical protein
MVRIDCRNTCKPEVSPNAACHVQTTAYLDTEVRELFHIGPNDHHKRNYGKEAHVVRANVENTADHFHGTTDTYQSATLELSLTMNRNACTPIYINIQMHRLHACNKNRSTWSIQA